jgi:[ribosomal protein S5]-alanine N-acetyltransferase
MSIIETERLLFRDHIDGDLETYCAMESDAVYRAPQRVHPRAELERSFRESVAPPKAMGLLATVFKPDGQYIGRCGLYPKHDDEGKVVAGEAVLAFYLARPYWGRGLATEAGRIFIQHGFGTLGLSRIVAGAAVANLASNRVIQKLGFVHVESGGSDGNRWHGYELRNPASSA